MSILSDEEIHSIAFPAESEFEAARGIEKATAEKIIGIIEAELAYVHGGTDKVVQQEIIHKIREAMK